jgi:hypothetical protein
MKILPPDAHFESEDAMSSLTSDKDIRRAARKLKIDKATLRDRLAHPAKLVEFAAELVRTGRPIETVVLYLGISEDKIAAECSRQEEREAKIRGMGATVFNLLENPPS